MNPTGLPGVTIDPKDEAELESAFGVTSNAEDLIRHNRSRYTVEQRETMKKEENPHLTDEIHDLDDDGNRLGLKSDLEDALGHPVQTAVVRGSGRNAMISYTFLDSRGAIEKGVTSYAEVFGSAKDKRAARAAKAADPDAAASEVLGKAEEDAKAKLEEAQEQAKKALAEAQEQAAKLVADAQAEADKIREAAAPEAAKAATAAEEKAAKAAAAKK